MSRHHSKRTKDWCWTLNNPAHDDEHYLDALHRHAATTYVVFQREVAPSTGTEHLQGFIQFTSGRSMDFVVELLNPEKAHWEHMRGNSQQAADYCKKDESRKDGHSVCERGAWVLRLGHLGRKGEKEALIQAVRAGKTPAQLCIELPTAVFGQLHALRDWMSTDPLVPAPPTAERVLPTVRWFFGASGVGKTSLALQEAQAVGPVFFKPAEDEWWTGYQGQPCIVLDEFNSNIKYTTFLRLLDRYPLQLRVHGGYTPCVATHIWITSSGPPSDCYPRISVEYRSHLRRRLDGRVFELRGGDEHCDGAVQLPSGDHVVLRRWWWPGRATVRQAYECRGQAAGNGVGVRPSGVRRTWATVSPHIAAFW
jgi:hypothetical protein